MIREWAARLVALVRRGAMRDRLDRELRLHRELLAEELAGRGSTSTPERELGPPSFRDAYVDQAGVPWLEQLWSDVRYAACAMRRAPVFTLLVIVILGLGIGVNTAIFSVVNGVLLKPLPYPDSERLTWLGEVAGPARGISVSWPNYVNWRDHNRSFEAIAAFLYGQATLTGRGEARPARGLSVTHEYFGLLGMQPLLGRLPVPDDDRPGAPATVVLNHRFWTDALGADPAVIGSALTLDGRPYEVIGVAAPVWEIRPVDYYLPLGRSLGAVTDRGRHDSMRVLGRLKPGVSVEGACADLDAIMRHLAEASPGPEDDHRSFGRVLAEQATGGARQPLLILMAAAGLVLLIACANVAGLLLARATTRGAEFAVRSAMGAGRGRLVRQLLTENVLIALTGGLAALLLAQWTRQLLIAMAGTDIPRIAETAIDQRALLFTAAVSLITGVTFGMAPVVTAGRIDLVTALKAGGRTVGGDARRQYARSALVAGEIALTFVLVFAALLLLRSLAAAQHTTSGVDARQVVSLELRLPASTYASPEAADDFYARLAAALRALPGAAGVTSAGCTAGAGGCGDWFYSLPGVAVPARNEVPLAFFTSVEPGYFGLMHVTLTQGREFDETDRPAGAKVAIVNATFARRWWPGQSAIGRTIKVGGPYIEGASLAIVGVVADVKQNGLDSEPQPEIYQPFAQRPESARVVLIRTAGEPESIMPAVREVVSRLDRNLPIQRLSALERTLDASLSRRRFNTILLTMFASLAVVLASAGIYGLLSYWVSVRQREIAIRLALGAAPSRILRWTGLQALRLAALGMTIGVAGAWAAALGLESVVFGIPSRSPATLLAAALAVSSIAGVAAAIPAWRAARVDAAAQLHGS